MHSIRPPAPSCSGPTCPTASIRVAASTWVRMPAFVHSCVSASHLTLMPTGNPDPMPKVVRIAIALLALVAANALVAQPLQPDIIVTRAINAPVADVWKAWTTTDGIESFFAPRRGKGVPEPGGAVGRW